MTPISLSDIADGPTVRTVPLPAGSDEALAASIAAEGVLTPILVRPVPSAAGSNRPGYQVVLGTRRVHAARAAGLTEIPAEVRELTDAQVRMAQMGDQTLRRSLHAVDQWRAVRAIVETDGFPPAIAARALGLDEKMVRRMDRIGRLPPTLLKLCETELPSDNHLVQLLRADPKSAVGATKSLTGLITQRRDGTDTVDWWAIVNRTKPARRASRMHAIFNVEASGLTWDEDLFAEPNTPDQFTTTDMAKFRRLQQEALTAKYAKAKKHRVVEPDETGGFPAIPQGYRISWQGSLDKPPANHVAFWCVADDGQIRGRPAVDLAALQAAQKSERKAAAGAIAEAVQEVGDAAAAIDDDDGGEDSEQDAVTAKVEAATGLTKAGMQMVHKAKTDALRQALRTQDIDAHDLLAFFVLAIGADNVRVGGIDATPDRLRAAAVKLVTPAGASAAPSDAEVRRIAQGFLARMLRIGESQTSYDLYSGAPAEWIGMMMRAGDYLPRFDTADFLAQCKGVELRAAAERGGVNWSGSGKAMRDRLAGQAEAWRPEAAVFGAAGPGAAERRRLQEMNDQERGDV